MLHVHRGIVAEFALMDITELPKDAIDVLVSVRNAKPRKVVSDPLMLFAFEMMFENSNYVICLYSLNFFNIIRSIITFKIDLS